MQNIEISATFSFFERLGAEVKLFGSDVEVIRFTIWWRWTLHTTTHTTMVFVQVVKMKSNIL